MDDAEVRPPLGQVASAEVPPSRVEAGLVRIRGRSGLRRGRAPQYAAAAAAVVAVAIPAGTGVPGHGPGPAAAHRPATPTVYVAYPNPFRVGSITPISTATNTPGKPIRVSFDGEIAATPNGKTLYVATSHTVIPISTATNTPGKPIRIGAGRAYGIAVNPDGKSAYIAGFANTVTPVNLATNRPGKPIRVGSFPGAIAFTPSGKTAYVVRPYYGPSLVTPINTATNTAGKPIRVAARAGTIAITPNGKTAYVVGLHTVTPINTATNKAGKPIRLGPNPTALIAISPDGKTVYVGAIGKVIPISTATNTPGKPIDIGTGIPAEEMVFTPNGKTAYVANGEGPTGRVIPISTATGAPGKPILIGVGTAIAITPAGKTVYAAALHKVVPISTATNTPGKPIRRVGRGLPNGIVITP